jgi:Putative auto-transporter adhesin, head GIN domain
MKRSQTVLLSAVAVVVVTALAMAVWVRIVTPPGATPPASLSGQRVTRQYDAANFSGVIVPRCGPQKNCPCCQWQVTLVRGDAWSVELSYPVELEPSVSVNVENDNLVLAFDGRSWWSDFGRRNELRMTARVVMPALDELQLAGATKLEMSGFMGNELALSAAGASTIVATECRYDELDLQMAGAGNADFSGLTATDAHVSIAGAHSVTLRMAGGTLSGSLAGASSLKYYGSVASENISKAGATSVRRLD